MIYFITWLMAGILIINLFSWNGDVINGKVFKIRNATYKCQKTNKLEVD